MNPTTMCYIYDVVYSYARDPKTRVLQIIDTVPRDHPPCQDLIRLMLKDMQVCDVLFFLHTIHT